MTNLSQNGEAVMAAIDIGTSSVKCLVAEVTPTGLGCVFLNDRTVTRLGEGLHESGLLQPDPMRRTLMAVGHHAGQALKAGAASIRIAGTSALREATNAGDFCSAVRQMVGTDVAVLDGEAEARLSYLGVGGMAGHDDLAMVDIGGGSTEWVLGRHGVIDYHHSFPAGAVRLTEALLIHDPPLPAEIEAARDRLRGLFSSVPTKRASTLVGVGGTVRAMLFVGNAHDGRGDSGEQPLEAKEVARQVSLYARLSVAERLAIPGMETARAPIILAGAMIVAACLEHSGRNVIQVTEKGLRHGLLLSPTWPP